MRRGHQTLFKMGFLDIGSDAVGYGELHPSNGQTRHYRLQCRFGEEEVCRFPRHSEW